MLKIRIRKRRLPDSVLIQGAKAQQAPASCFHSPVFQPPAASISTAAQESLCLFTRNTAQCILCPPTSQELGTSPKGTSPYWDKVEAHPWVLRLYPCCADLSILCMWTKLCPQNPILPLDSKACLPPSRVMDVEEDV